MASLNPSDVPLILAEPALQGVTHNDPELEVLPDRISFPIAGTVSIVVTSSRDIHLRAGILSASLVKGEDLTGVGWREALAGHVSYWHDAFTS